MKKRSRLLFSISMIMASVAVASYLHLTLSGTQSTAAANTVRQDLKSSGLANRAPVEGILRRVDGKKVTYRVMIGRMYDFPVEYRQQVARYLNQRLRERAMTGYETVWVDRATPGDRLRLRVTEATTALSVVCGLFMLVGLFGVFRSLFNGVKAIGVATANRTGAAMKSVRDLGPVRSMRRKMKHLESENTRLQEEVKGVTHFWEITSNDLQEVKARHKRTLQENKALKERLRLSLRQIGFLEDQTLIKKLEDKGVDFVETGAEDLGFVESETAAAATAETGEMTTAVATTAATQQAAGGITTTLASIAKGDLLIPTLEISNTSDVDSENV